MNNGEWHCKPPCPEEELQRFIQTATVELPSDYLAYLRESNGGGGDIGVEPGVVFFWKADEVPLNNDGYEVHRNVPGFYAFGSSGGGEMFAFDARGRQPWPVVRIPFIPMCAEEAVQIAPDFAAFRRTFGVRLDEPSDEIRLDGWGHPLGSDDEVRLNESGKKHDADDGKLQGD